MLEAEVLVDFRADIGDSGTPPAFSDAELQRLYERTGEDYNRAVLLAFDQLLSGAAKFASYTQNQTQEKKSEIFNNLLKLRTLWAGKVAALEAAESAKQQVRLAGLTRQPKRLKDAP